MICPNGHGFDVGEDDRCPMCGTRLKRRSSKAKLHEVTRGDLWVIRDGLKAADGRKVRDEGLAAGERGR